MKLESLRLGQRQALETVINRLSRREPYTTIVLPTRYGKSDVMRLVAIEGERQKCLGWSLVLSPLSYLRDQIINAHKLRAFTHRYDVDRSFASRCFAWSNSVRTEDIFEQRGRFFISATACMATRNVAICVDLADEVLNRTGQPLIVQIDECHEVSAQKKRGELLRALTDVGALCVLYTATPIRSDGELIPGFETETLDDRTLHRYELTGEIDEASGRERIRVYGVAQELRRLIPHHETSYREAWNEKPSPICRLTRDVIDVDLARVLEDGTNETRKLSECDITTARRALGRAIRNHEVIAKGANMLVDELILRRQARPDTAAIIFTGNDETNDDQDNKHAKAIEKAIHQAARQKRARFGVKIITMKSEEGNSTTDELRKFVDEGDGDVLIVKQIGGAGLDCERIKVVLDLSSVRTVASFMQRVMRCATPWGDCKIGTVITLADPMTRCVWEQFIVSEGGEGPKDWQTIDEWFEREQLKRDPRDDPRFVVNGAGLGLFDDSDGGAGRRDQWDAVRAFLEDFPEVGDRYTKPEIAEKLQRWNLRSERPTDSESLVEFESADKQCDRFNKQLNALISEAAKSRGVRYTPDDAAAWVAFFEETYGALKQACGIPLNRKTATITDPNILRRMLAKAQEMFGV